MSASAIKSIKSLGIKPTYNVTMKSDQHNYKICVPDSKGVISANSHSVCYSYIAYVTAYLKTYFTLEFFAALMSVELHSGQKKANEKTKLEYYKEEAEKFGINFLGVDVNASKKDYVIEGEKTLRCPVGLIKGCGGKAEEELLLKQPFASIDDFVNKVETSIINTGVVNALIDAGAFDSFGSKKDVRKKLEQAKIRKDKLKIRNSNIPFIPQEITQQLM